MTSNEAFKHCCTGHLATGTAVGSLTTIAGRETYITGPKSSRALLIIADIWGISNNIKLVADYYAKEGNITVYVPDFFDGQPAPLSLMYNNEEWKTYDLQGFVTRNSKDIRYPQMAKVAIELKEKHGVTMLAAMGVCYGGWGTLRLSRDHLADAIILCHPSFVEFPNQIEQITTPSLWLLAQTDNQVPKDKRDLIEAILEKKTNLPSKIAFYPGTEHGFVVRGDSTVEHVRIAAEDASLQGVNFINRFLHKSKF